MKVEELKIGNIIEVNHFEYGDMYASVISINDTGDLCLHLLDERFTKEEYECTLNEVCSIPITEELLLNNGFDNRNNLASLYLGENVFSLTKHPDLNGLWLSLIKEEDGWQIHSLCADNYGMSNFVRPIHYVHEMQNFLSLVKHGFNIKISYKSELCGKH